MTHGRMGRAGRMAVVVLLAACSKAENNPADSAAPLAVAQNPAAALRQAGPGELTKPVADYTGEELYALVRSLQYAGDTIGTRRCKDLPGCGGLNPTRTTRLSVAAVVGEDSIVPTNVPQFGVIVSKGSNLGGAPDLMYGMRPGNRFEYYLIVLPGPQGGATARWQIEQLEVVGNARSHSPLTTGTFSGCGHVYERGPKAGFYTCSQAVVRPASTGALLQAIDPPWWISCSAGCCVSESSGGIG